MNDLQRRLDALEDRRARLDLFQVASRIAEAEGLDAGELIREAEDLAERMAWLGVDGVIEALATEAGVTPDMIRADLATLEERYPCH